MVLRWGIALITGILMGLTPAPVGAWPLAWIALAPLWVLVVEESKKIKEKGGKKEKEEKPSFLNFGFLLLPLLWGIGYHGLALFWITGVHPMTWLGVPWLASLAIAFFCWVAIALWGSALVTLWAVCHGLAASIQPARTWLMRVLIGTALWCGLEYIWSSSPLWWNALAYTQSPHNLAILHLGQLSGSSTVTAAIVAVNGFIAEAWMAVMARGDGRDKREKKLTLVYCLLPVTCCLLFHIVGFWLYSRPLIQPQETALKVGIIQGNIANEIKMQSEGWRRALAGYTTGYQALAEQGVNAVLTPETALPFLWTEENREVSSFYQAILDKGVVSWVGTFGDSGNSFTNSLFTVTAKGETFSRYDKTKLVPLGEYIPFEKFLGRIINRLSPLDAHLVAGEAGQVFDTPFGRAIVGICYDSAFSEHFRRQAAAGGQFILSASNDAHYAPSMALQHHALDVMRAIETDRWAVRATNTGHSAIADPHGRTQWISQMKTYTIHADTIYRRQTQTLYVRWGDWLTPVLLGLGAIALILNLGWKRTEN